jgi:hypothetical protein
VKVLFQAVAAAVTLVLMTAVPAAGQPRRASLTLDSIAPLRVSGRDFGTRESVLLTYIAADGTSRDVTVRAAKDGALRGGFKLRLGRCDSFTVRAAGAAGSRAVLQVERRCENTKGPPKQAPREKPKPPRG